MNYTNAYLIEILKNAKERHLKRTRNWDNSGYCQTTYVCHTIRNAMEVDGHKWTIPEKLEKLVRRHIGTGVMDVFLKKQFGDSRYARMTYEQIQDWRALMIDNMIKILQAEGKK